MILNAFQVNSDKSGDPGANLWHVKIMSEQIGSADAYIFNIASW
jgi:hypothetical protein